MAIYRLKYLILTPYLFFVVSCRTPEINSIEIEATNNTFDYIDNNFSRIDHPEVNRLLARITSRLNDAVPTAALEPEAANALDGSLKTYRFQVFVIKSNEPNAFSLGSGIIFITSALITNCKKEAELASIISHEMAHQLLGHTSQAISSAIKSAEFSNADRQGNKPQFAHIPQQEIEADSLGLIIMKIARYDISHAVHAMISIGNRQFTKKVSSDSRNNGAADELLTRTANLHRMISSTAYFFPLTESTREFNRVRRIIAGTA